LPSRDVIENVQSTIYELSRMIEKSDTSLSMCEKTDGVDGVDDIALESLDLRLTGYHQGGREGV
jgi:hypothetical protein